MVNLKHFSQLFYSFVVAVVAYLGAKLDQRFKVVVQARVSLAVVVVVHLVNAEGDLSLLGLLFLFPDLILIVVLAFDRVVNLNMDIAVCFLAHREEQLLFV